MRIKERKHTWLFLLLPTYLLYSHVTHVLARSSSEVI